MKRRSARALFPVLVATWGVACSTGPPGNEGQTVVLVPIERHLCDLMDSAEREGADAIRQADSLGLYASPPSRISRALPWDSSTGLASSLGQLEATLHESDVEARFAVRETQSGFCSAAGPRSEVMHRYQAHMFDADYLSDSWTVTSSEFEYVEHRWTWPARAAPTPLLRLAEDKGLEPGQDGAGSTFVFLIRESVVGASIVVEYRRRTVEEPVFLGGYEQTPQVFMLARIGSL